MQALLSIFLAVLMALGVSLRLTADPAVTAGAFPPAATAAPSAPGGTDWADMEYVRYDTQAFYLQVQQLSDLGQAGDEQAVAALYDALYAELVHIDTLSAIAYIRYSSDVTDPYWSEQMVYCSQTASQTADALETACHALLQGPCGEAFAAHVGPDAAEAFAAYTPMTDRERELTDREAVLVDTYYETLDRADTVTYPYRGESWDMDMISGSPGLSLAYQDYEGYLEVYYGLQQAVNEMVGPVFVDLVQLRAELARLEGCASYADLAYERLYGRDYTGAQAQALCDEAKALGREYYGGVYHSALGESAASSPAMGAAQLLELLGACAGRVDPGLTPCWQFMTEHGLCCLAGGGDRLPSSYTTALCEYGSAYVFVGLAGNGGDLGTLAHEFGHFVNALRHPVQNILTGGGSLDLMEIHSTGLEALFTEFYDEIYADGADAARFSALADLIESVLSGCILDEFQRRIYAQPDMTLDEMDRLYAGICAQYGRYEPTGVDYSWMYIHHNFESPLYYISYAVSALAAIQIWDLAREDFAAGAAAWEAVLDHDACTESYRDVLAACGLRPFTEPGAAADICRPLLDELERLDNRSQQIN